MKFKGRKYFFKYDTKMWTLDIYQIGKDLPVYSIFNKRFVDFADFAKFCSKWDREENRII